MKATESILAALSSAALIGALSLAGLSGCEKGPMEKAGEKVDDAVEEAGDAIEDAGDKIEDALDP